MVEIIIYVLVAVMVGGVIGWLLGKSKNNHSFQTERENLLQKNNELEKELVGYKATTSAHLEAAKAATAILHNQLGELNENQLTNRSEVSELNKKLAFLSANYDSARQNLIERTNEVLRTKEEVKSVRSELDSIGQSLATQKAHNDALNEKLATQKEEMQKMGEKFNLEFENIANKILEVKSEKFTELNRNNLKSILDPLGENITAFKKQINEVYEKESKERFSLGVHVKELSLLNKMISEEAHNLTKALKGEAKTQGNWGQMILENILERSGLRKDQEYFLEYQLMGEDGKPLRSDSENKKMRPDVVIKYPDNRNVIIDSKVSLNAFTRMVAANDLETQQSEAYAHVSAIKNHILSLSAKGYDDFDKSLDFVMMFVPSEPAYNVALQSDADLWNFAYDRRILLLSPTNLITSLKLIVDLWKREYQNKNAQEIAERGAKLYDKFVGFIENLESVGSYLESAQTKYGEAFKQLSTGKDNLITQATKLKSLGLKTKKELPESFDNL